MEIFGIMILGGRTRIMAACGTATRIIGTLIIAARGTARAAIAVLFASILAAIACPARAWAICGLPSVLAICAPVLSARAEAPKRCAAAPRAGRFPP